jgi:hypothetical protein
MNTIREDAGVKFKIVTMAGLMLIGVGHASSATPPLDRPTPPPRCADGRCYPNTLMCGYYETRWRRWPVEAVEPSTTGEFNPQQLQKQVPPFSAPSPEEEDRKAPPPTVTHEEPGHQLPPKSGATSSAPGPEGTTPPTVPLRPPGEQSEPAGPRRTLPPYEPQAPGARPLPPGGPTGELDPPPALPFGPAPIQEAAPVRQVNRTPEIRTAQPIRAANPQLQGVNSSSDDPPPALPGTLAALLN